MIRRRSRRPAVEAGPKRRSGPAGEAVWWDAADQAWAESPLLEAADFGKGWRAIPMVNNVEQLDPFGPGEAADAIRAARVARTLTALDEGEAWRRRNDALLAVGRAEVYAEVDDRTHRAAWAEHGAACLEATWRARWRERDVEPGWIEATALADDDRPSDDLGAEVDAAVDWFEVEDHTGGDVARYQYLTMWFGRLQYTLTVRHLPGVDLREPIAAAAVAISRRSGPGRGSA